MLVFPLSFKEVVVFLGAAHLIAISKLSKFEARIKDFQRRGFPPGLNTGKGKAAEYGAEQVILLMLAFELLELGMTPEKICSLLGISGGTIVHEFRNICRRGRGTILKKNQTIVYFDPQGLSYLRDDGDDFSALDPKIIVGVPSDLKRMFSDSINESKRLAVLDLFALVDVLLSCLISAKNCSIEEAVGSLLEWAREYDGNPEA